MPAPANLVHMNSVTTGTGNVTLSAVNGKQTFAQAFGTGGTDVFDYFISNQGAAEWERGTGHLSSATVLVRDTVLESSNSNALVNFSAGTKDVANDIPAALQYYKGGPLGTPDSGTLTNCTGLPTAGLVANAVTNAKLAKMASNTIKGNNTGSTADPSDLTVSQLQVMLTAHPTVQVFTASGTWTRPTGCRRIRVRIVGGGGGGAGATAASGQCCVASGGGSGAYSEGVFDVTSTSSASVTIGAGGAAGAAANGTGGTGGTSAFGSLITGVIGGTGGSAMTSGTAVAFITGSSPASAGSGGYLNAGGNSGQYSRRDSATVFMSGAGGPSVFGGGGRGVNFAAAGTHGGAPGAGGGGAASASATGYAGGAGAAGIAIVEEFY